MDEKHQRICAIFDLLVMEENYYKPSPLTPLPSLRSGRGELFNSPLPFMGEGLGRVCRLQGGLGVLCRHPPN